MGQEGVTGVRPIVEVVAAPIVNYAMAHGGIAFLHRIVVTIPPSAGDVDDLLVHAEVVDAQGDVLTRPWQHHVDSLRAGIPLVVDHPAIRLDARYLAELEEETTAEVVVTVSTAGRELGRAYTPVRVLAARQWSLDPAAPVLSLELLASFVQPNHPAVGPIVARGAAILADRTKSGSLQVTYVDPERDRRDRRRGVHGGPRARRLLRRTAGQLGLRPEGPDARGRVRAARRDLPRHDGRPRVVPRARGHHPRRLGGPRARLPRVLAPRRAGPARRREPPDRAGCERGRPRADGCRRDHDGHPRAPAAQGPVPPGRPGAQGRVLPRRLLRAGRGGRRRDGPADAGAPRPRPARPRRRRGRAGGVHAGGPAGGHDRHRGDPHTGAVVRTRPATAATRRAAAGPGLEERPARPHPAQPAAQPRRPDDAGAAGHAERTARPPRADPPGGEDGLGPRGRRPRRRRRRGPQPRRLLAAGRRPARACSPAGRRSTRGMRRTSTRRR